LASKIGAFPESDMRCQKIILKSLWNNQSFSYLFNSCPWARCVYLWYLRFICTWVRFRI